MFAFIRSRPLFIPVLTCPSPSRLFYSTISLLELRRLPAEELIDTMLAAEKKWGDERDKLRDQVHMAEKQFYVTQTLLKDQLLASERNRNIVSESRLRSEIELKLTKLRIRDLQILLLRNQNRFHFRGIIELIADQPDYDTSLSDDARLPHRRQGTQPRLDWISAYSPSYARFREKILHHRRIRRTDFDRSSRSLYHELSKHFHENRIPLDSNQDDIIVDMTQAYTSGVFSTQDGAVLESFLHYRFVPYTAITDAAVEVYAPGELGGDLRRTVMPLAYREQPYARMLSERDVDAHGENESGGVERAVSMGP